MKIVTLAFFSLYNWYFIRSENFSANQQLVLALNYLVVIANYFINKELFDFVEGPEKPALIANLKMQIQSQNNLKRITVFSNFLSMSFESYLVIW